MIDYKIGGILIGGILALVASLKIELLKEVARKITSDKEKASILSYVILAGLFIIPALLGYIIPSGEATDNDPPEIVSKKDTGTSQVNDIAGAVKDAAVLGNEISDKVIEAKQKREQDFQSNRPQRWVYQIGERINIRNDEDLLALYGQIKDVNNLSLFRIGSDLLIFRNEEHSKEELENGLGEFKSQINNVANVHMIDLMSFCDARNPNIVDKKRHKFGKKKNKAQLPCYVCN